MGAGRSQEAAFVLKAPVGAGTYHFVLDAVIVQAVDVTFDLIWRRGETDMPVVSWTEHFEPLGGGNFDAQPFEYDQPAPAITWKSGDELVFRYTGSNSISRAAYIPNGDGAITHGRIPHINLP